MIWAPFDTFELTRDPWLMLKQLHQEMDSLFGAGQSYGRYEALPMNLNASEDEAYLSMQIPGIDPKDIDIQILGETISITGELRSDESDVKYLTKERLTGKFSRSSKLPFIVDAEKVSAEYINGILRITLPRAEADKPRKISIK